MDFINKIKANKFYNIIRKGKKSHVGLDIGSYSLKIVEVLPDREKLIIKKLGVHELPPGPLEQTLPEGLKSLLAATPIDTKVANISVSGSDVVVRFVELPLMHDAELLQALPYEAEKYIPFDINETILDYTILEKNQAEKNMKVLFVGARSDSVEKRTKLLKDIGLIPHIMDVDAFAIFNVFVKGVPPNELNNKTVALLNIGSSLSSIVVVDGGSLRMVRDIDLGGAKFTQSLQDQLKVDAKEAQTLKHGSSTGRDEEVFSVLKGVFQKLVDELKLSFSYFEDKHGKGVDEIYISGGSAGLKSLIPFLKESSGLEVKQWNPLVPFEVDPQIPKEILDKYSSSLAVCCGLALRG